MTIETIRQHDRGDPARGRKADHLNRDKSTPLSAEVVADFALALQQAANLPKMSEAWNHAAMQAWVDAINADAAFPLSAQIVDGRVQLTAQMDAAHPPMLKQLSDGITNVYCETVRRLQVQP